MPGRWVIAPVASATQNGVVRARLGHLSPTQRRRRIVEVLDRFRQRRVYMSWWTGPATQPPELSDELRAAGMSFGDPPAWRPTCARCARLEFRHFGQPMELMY